MEFVDLGWEAWFTVGVLVVLIVSLMRDLARPELIMLGGLGLLLVFNVVTPEQAFAGLSNPAVLTIAALYVVAAGVQRTEVLQALDRVLLTDSGRLGRTLPRLMGVTAFLSAFLNNTPIVAMLMPRVQQWAHEKRLPATWLLIPLSYAAILGGMTTLIGTSTNIVVSGLLEEYGYPPLGMFELTWVGVPAVIVVIVYFSLFGYRLLPKRIDGSGFFEEGLKDCLFELRVSDRSPLTGRTIEELGLRNLGGAYLAHIRRKTRLIPATPSEQLFPGDTLTFTGDVSVLDRLKEMPGLERTMSPLQEDEFETLPLFEAVVAESSDLVGKTLQEVKFRETYQGVVLGIQRQNRRVGGVLGRTPLEAGDLLLIEAPNGFDRRWNQNRKEFFLVAARRAESSKSRAHKAPVAILILLGMVIAFTTNIIPLVTAAFAAALAMIVTRCIRGRDARAVVNFSVLAVIAAALGIGKAVESTGLAQASGNLIATLAYDLSPIAVIGVLYLATNFLTELLTNQAAAILMVPIGMAVAADLGLDAGAVAVTIAVAASASFMTPFGYQTNLMVMAAGGYKFTDYTKAGFPVSLLVMTVTITVVYLLWM